MTTIKVVNIKCGGCENMIKTSLTEAGLFNVSVSVEKQEVSFDGDAVKAKELLTKMGYPPADSPEAQSFLKKAQSYASCMIGRVKK